MLKQSNWNEFAISAMQGFTWTLLICTLIDTIRMVVIK